LNRIIKLALTAACAIIIVVLVAFFVNQALNPDLAAYTTQAQKVFSQAVGKVEQIRNVTLPPATLYVITRQEAVDRWGKGSANADLPNILRQEKIYKGLFLMGENDSLYQATVDWTANWGAATLGNDIYVIMENFDPWAMPNAEATFVHELTHVWEPDLSSPVSFDESKAHDALVEGDASYMSDFFKENYGSRADSGGLGGGSFSVFLLDNPLLVSVHPIPAAVSNLNWFPYVQGKTFVTALYERGGWATVNQAYDLGYTPSSTEQILHVDKYLANETAKKVELSAALTENNWSIIRTNRGEKAESYGEYFIQNMLSNWITENQSQVAKEAAAGWGGDSFAYYERGSDFLFTWNIAWDSSKDASEFFVAFKKMVDLTGATSLGSNEWVENGRYLTLNWETSSDLTFIACSTNRSAVQPSYFG
jgi:hypothetical protein